MKITKENGYNVYHVKDNQFRITEVSKGYFNVELRSIKLESEIATFLCLIPYVKYKSVSHWEKMPSWFFNSIKECIERL